MKYFFFTVILFVSGYLVALPVGNPAEPRLLTQSFFGQNSYMNPSHPMFQKLEKVSFRLGYYQDNVVNRNLTQEDTGCDSDQKTLDSLINTYAAYLAFNYSNYLEGFCTLGATNYEYAANRLDWGFKTAPADRSENPKSWVVSESSFSWSVGGRLVFFECKGMTCGIEGQYLHTRPKIGYVNSSNAPIDGSTMLFMGSSSMATNYSEWQIGLGSAWQVGWFVPYVAVKCSSARLKMGEPIWRTNTVLPDFIQLKNLQESKNWGFAVGLSLINCQVADLTLEMRGGDEQGYYLNGQLRF